MSAFDAFVNAARMRAAELWVDVATVDTCGASLVAAFPDEWMRANDLPGSGALATAKAHPVSDLLVTTGQQQLTGLLELGSYLSWFAECGELAELHAGLRGDELLFEHTRLQLAFAYRLALSGAANVQFEPSADGGRRGDIAFDWDEIPFRVECYRPAVVDQQSVETELLLTQCRDALVKVGIPLIAEIRLGSLPDPQCRKQAVARVGQLGQEMAHALKNGLRPTGLLFDRIPYGTVGVRVGDGARVVPAGAPLLTVSSRRGEKPPRQVLTGREARSETGPDGQVARVHLRGERTVRLWLPDADEPTKTGDISEPMMKLANRIEKKLRQAKTGHARRVVVVETGLTAVLSGPGDSRLTRFRKKLLKHHSNVAAILLVRRHWDERLQSWRYQILALAEDGEFALPRTLFHSLRSVEVAGVWETRSQPRREEDPAREQTA